MVLECTCRWHGTFDEMIKVSNHIEDLLYCPECNKKLYNTRKKRRFCDLYNPTCEKKTFLTYTEAYARCDLINKRKSTKKGKPLRPYKCTECGLYHTTSMTDHEFKMKFDPMYRKLHNAKTNNDFFKK